MTDSREFPTEVIASLTSGVLLCKFSEMQEAAKFIMGGPIWTHQLSSKAFCVHIQRVILEQHPDMITELPDVTKENYLDKVSELVVKYGNSVRVQKGTGKELLI